MLSASKNLPERKSLLDVYLNFFFVVHDLFFPSYMNLLTALKTATPLSCVHESCFLLHVSTGVTQDSSVKTRHLIDHSVCGSALQTVPF
jgi:hypothetical protein